MWEFEVRNKQTGEITLFFGYNFEDACKRVGELPINWENLGKWYID